MRETPAGSVGHGAGRGGAGRGGAGAFRRRAQYLMRKTSDRKRASSAEYCLSISVLCSARVLFTHLHRHRAHPAHVLSVRSHECAAFVRDSRCGRFGTSG
jgi:hypothetical protein